MKSTSPSRKPEPQPRNTKTDTRKPENEVWNRKPRPEIKHGTRKLKSGNRNTITEK